MHAVSTTPMVQFIKSPLLACSDCVVAVLWPDHQEIATKMSILLPALQHHHYFVLNSFSTISMPRTSNRTNQLREAAARACSVHAQSQSTTTVASTRGDLVTSSLRNTPERVSHVSTIHSTVGDEESSVDINEHDQETSPA